MLEPNLASNKFELMFFKRFELFFIKYQKINLINKVDNDNKIIKFEKKLIFIFKKNNIV
jgi:hypothetical protein